MNNKRASASQAPWAKVAFSFVLAFLTVLPSYCLASSPQLNIIMPRGVKRGGDHVLTFSGARLENAQEVFLYSQGVQVTNIEQVDANNVKVTITVAADCRLGEHVAQLRTTTGISEYRSFFVGAMSEVAEVEPNNSFGSPQAIEKNLTVTGVIQNEDVDYYSIEAKQGERISVEIEGIRLGNAMVDPYVAILDANRFEIAAADDTPLLKQDCFCAISAPADGTYVIMVRDAAYGGNGNCRYRLHVGNFPRPTVVYPAGGQIGQAMDVQFLGDVAGPIPQNVTVAAQESFRNGMFVQDEQGISPSPVFFRSVEYGNVLEAEPNDSRDTATVAQLPLAINGIIEKPGDHDWFKFTGKQGQVYDFELFARRIRSGLDSVINIYGPDGAHIQGNDDSRGPDSYLRLQLPADGDYTIRVRDHLGRGDPTFVYRIEIQPVKPGLSVSIPRVARYSQYRQSIFIPKGNRFATLMTANRMDFGGGIKLASDQLPPGVTMHFQPMADNLNIMPVVFEAAEDAELTGKLVDLIASHVDDATNISGGYSNTGMFVLGPPNNAMYVGCNVDRLPVAVIDKVPFKLEVVQPNAPLVRDGVINIKVIAHRDEGFNQPIRVEFPFRPPGVGTTGNIQIAADQTEAVYPLNANGNAQIREWPFYVLGSSNVNGAAWVSSQLATLNVAERYVSMEMKRAACEQGQETQMLCTMNQITAFEGKGKAELLGLPPHTEVEALEFDATTSELVFNIKTKPETPAGKHRGVFCRVTIMVNGEPVVATAGRSELQVDKPIVQPVAQAQPKPEEKPAAPPAAKPLSRLEKLRQAARDNKENGK